MTTAAAPEAARAPAAVARPATGQAALAACLITLATAAAYSNSVQAPFLFDDGPQIVHSRAVHQLATAWPELVRKERPLARLSFAVNYAAGGLEVWGYHLVNLAVHVLAALALYGVLRRTLEADPCRSFRPAATSLALVISLAWALHPLQTESVTYIVQRSEAMMGLFYVLTIYGVARGATAGRSRWAWYAAAVVACALGMASKEVMVTAPVVVLLYDRVFLARSWAEVWRRRWGLYMGLAATWAVLGASFLTAFGARSGAMSGGFAMRGLTPWQYAASQPAVILHYLALTFRPVGLCFDYAWPVARTTHEVLPAAAALAVLLLATAWALWRWPAVGFWAAWFFIILAPTSSLMPIRDLAFEHRVYLSLAGVLVVVVLAGFALAQAAARRWPATRLAAAVTAVVAVLVLGGLTHARNEVYRDEKTIWLDVVTRRPANPRGHTNLGMAYAKAGRDVDALAEFDRALALDPDFAPALNDKGVTLYQLGRLEPAAGCLERAVALEPGFADWHFNLGRVLAKLGKPAEAERAYAAALALDPDHEAAHTSLGALLGKQGRLDEAVEHFAAAVRLSPDTPENHLNLGTALARSGRRAEAAEQWATVDRLASGAGGDRGPLVLDALAAAYAAAGQPAEAAATLRKAITQARDAGRPALAERLQARLQLYQQPAEGGTP